MLLRRLCPGTMDDVFGFDMPIVSCAEKVEFPRYLPRLVRRVNDMSEYRGLDLSRFKDALDGFYIVKNTDAWSRELKLEDWQRHHARDPCFVG